MDIVTVSNLSFNFENSTLQVLKNISFSLKKGSYTSILGLNGSGKSTLARLICGYLSPTKGTIQVKTETPLENFYHLLKNKKTQVQEKTPLGFVFQSPKDQIITEIVQQDTQFGPENLHLCSETVLLRAKNALEKVKLSDKENAPTFSLSLGQMQKLALAGILALNSEILVLDESLSMIDPLSRQEILDFLDELHRNGLTILHITHDEEEAKRSESILALEDGSLIFNGTTKEYFANKVIREQIFGLPLEKKRTPQEQTETNLWCKNLSFSYNTQTLFKDFSLAFNKGCLTAIMGPSGSGKSTLLEIFAGLIPPTAGKIFSLEQKFPPLALQDCDSALFEDFAADDVAFGPSNFGISGKKLKKCVQDAMNSVNLPFEDFKEKRTFQLSGGQKRKLSLAGIIALDSDIYLFDEPTAALDPVSRKNILQILEQLAQKGKTVIFTTHRQEEANFADRLLKIENGSLTYDSAPVPIPDNSSSVPLETQPESHMLSSIKKASLGKYEEKKSFIHTLPAHSKYLAFFFCFFLGIFATHKTTFLSAGLSILIYGLLAKTSFKDIFMRIVKVIPLLAFFAFLQLFLFPAQEGAQILFQWKWINFTDQKLRIVIHTFFHTIFAIASLSIFITSISAREIVEGMKTLLKPLHFCGIKTQRFTMLIAIVFRFIPLLLMETTLIIKAQLVRGGFKTSKGFLGKIKAMIPLFVPLILQTLKRSDALAETLTARYFN